MIHLMSFPYWLQHLGMSQTKARNQNSTQVSQGLLGAQVVGPFSTTFPSALAGSVTGKGATGIRTGTPTWDTMSHIATACYTTLLASHFDIQNHDLLRNNFCG